MRFPESAARPLVDPDGLQGDRPVGVRSHPRKACATAAFEWDLDGAGARQAPEGAGTCRHEGSARSDARVLDEPRNPLRHVSGGDAATRASGAEGGEGDTAVLDRPSRVLGAGSSPEPSRPRGAVGYSALRKEMKRLETRALARLPPDERQAAERASIHRLRHSSATRAAEAGSCRTTSKSGFGRWTRGRQPATTGLSSSASIRFGEGGGSPPTACPRAVRKDGKKSMTAGAPLRTGDDARLDRGPRGEAGSNAFAPPRDFGVSRTLEGRL